MAVRTQRMTSLKFRPRLESFEDRMVPAAGFTPVPDNAVVICSEDGGSPEVQIVDPVSGKLIDKIQVYERSFRGGARAALGDVNGDGVKDIVVVPGTGGGPRVEVLDGKSGTVIADRFVYEPSFTGGLYVATGDVNGDGKADIITGTGVGGGPRVRVLDGATLGQTVLKDYFAYEDSFRGGVQVGSGDVNGDGKDDMITGTGVGGGPRVEVFSGTDDHVLANYFAYEDSFRGGVQVASGDVNGDGKDDIITGTGPGGGPLVKVVSGSDGSMLSQFLSDDVGFRGGVRVGAEDVNHDGKDEVLGRTRHGNRVDLRVSDGESGSSMGSVSGQVDDDPAGDDHSTPPPGGGLAPGSTLVEGVVTAVDAVAGTATIRKEDDSIVVVQTGPSSFVERNHLHATLADVQVGDKAEAMIGTDGIAIFLEAKAP